MAERQLGTLLEGGAFFEGPRWRDGRWWVSDFYRRTVYTVTPDGAEQEVLRVEEEPSGLGWMPDGSLLVVSRKDFRILRRAPGGELSEHADLSQLAKGHLNDMVVDGGGRAYVGNFGFDLMTGADPSPTDLVRVDPDGTVTVVAGELWFPNGTVITPDGATLIVGEMIAARYTAFTIAGDGSLGERRVWGQMEPEPGFDSYGQTLAGLRFAPDGCSLDAEGHIWSADAIGGRAARVAPGGEVVDEVRVPAGLGVFACMLGGEDGRTLLICAAPDFLERNRQDRREAVLLTNTVDVPHAGLP
ncbi:MAG: SMP-30/gluconolactonase/LRE family protein [Solirubrobacteraceae bacterium]